MKRIIIWIQYDRLYPKRPNGQIMWSKILILWLWTTNMIFIKHRCSQKIIFHFEYAILISLIPGKGLCIRLYQYIGRHTKTKDPKAKNWLWIKWHSRCLFTSFFCLGLYLWFGGQNQLWKYIKYAWKVKWLWLDMNDVEDPKEWEKCVQDIIIKLAVDQYGFKILVLTLFYLFQGGKR